MILKTGKWVKFAAWQGFDDAHRSPDGMVVGIYKDAEIVAGEPDAKGRPTEVFVPASVVVVRPDGTDLMVDGESVRVGVPTIGALRLADPIIDTPLPRVEHILTPQMREARDIAYHYNSTVIAG